MSGGLAVFHYLLNSQKDYVSGKKDPSAFFHPAFLWWFSQNAFNMVELQRSLQPSPAQSLRYSYPQSTISYPQTKPPQDSKKVVSNWNGSAAIALRLAIPPSETETLPSPLTFRRSQKTLSFSSQDLARYLCEVIRDMEHPGELSTMTTPRRTSRKEGKLAAVRSLSTLSASQGSEARLQAAQSTRLDRFKTLRAMVSDLRGESKIPESQRDKVKESRGQLNCEKSGWGCTRRNRTEGCKNSNPNQKEGLEFQREIIKCEILWDWVYEVCYKCTVLMNLWTFKFFDIQHVYQWMIRCDVLFAWHCTVQYLINRQQFLEVPRVKALHFIKFTRVMSSNKMANELPVRELGSSCC